MITRYTLERMGKIWSDENRFGKWLQVEILACEALAEQGKVPAEDLKNIKTKAKFDLARIDEIERTVHHDVIAFVTSVQEFIGESGRFVHMGLTSSDVVDTALAALMQEAADILIADMDQLIEAVAVKAKEYKMTPMVGRSHGVHAEPITLGLKFLLMKEEMQRAKERLQRARSVISFGKVSGAVGTYAHLGPEVEEFVCRGMGLQPAPISTQVLQRDRHAEYMSMLALVGDSLQRWAQEIRSLQRTEVREVEEPFRKGQKGSSAMPHKRNPVICERICGLARVLVGYASTAHQNVALWHERDISHSSAERVIVPDGTMVLDYMLHKMTEVIKDLHVYPENMQKNLDLTRGLVFSQRVLMKMLEKGLSRNDAYKVIQDNAMACWRGEGALLELLLKDQRVGKCVPEKELKECFEADYYLRFVDDIFKKCNL